MSSEPKVGEVWEVGAGPHVGRLGVVEKSYATGVMDVRVGGASTLHRYWPFNLKRRVELREGQVWRGGEGLAGSISGFYFKSGPPIGIFETADGKLRPVSIADMVREGWTLVSEPSEEKPIKGADGGHRVRGDNVLRLDHGSPVPQYNVTGYRLRVGDGEPEEAPSPYEMRERVDAVLGGMRGDVGVVAAKDPRRFVFDGVEQRDDVFMHVGSGQKTTFSSKRPTERYDFATCRWVPYNGEVLEEGAHRIRTVVNRRDIATVQTPDLPDELVPPYKSPDPVVVGVDRASAKPTEETDEELRERLRYMRPSIASSHFVHDTRKGELATVSLGAMTTERLRAVAESFGFYDPKTVEWSVEWTNDQPIDMRPLAEAFAAIAKAMQTPRGIVVLNRQWCDEQVANPPRWARDGRGVARGERFEAFKVGLCNEVAKWGEVSRFSNGRTSGPHMASIDLVPVLQEVRQYVDQQCGEAPAWA